VLSCTYHTAADILFLDFFEGLITGYRFWKSTQQKQYFEDTLEITLSDTVCFLSSDERVYPSSLDEEFFLFYKERYLSGLAFNRWRGFIPKIALYT
jgi:hypothetical protein